jgi:nucleotide-binding universal stress UspA family protein
MQSEGIFKRILVPMDESPRLHACSSAIAQQLSALITEEFHSEVTVLHVVSPGLMRPRLRETFTEISGPTQSGVRLAREHERAYEEGKKSLSDAADLFKQKGIAVEERIVDHADPAEAIIEEAEKGDYELIIMGQSGEKERKPHLGSVAEKVSQCARAPVLIARERSSVSRMLVPIDGSENAGKALEYAAAIAREANAKITLLYVLERSLFKSKSEEAKKMGALILSKAANEVKEIELHQQLESGNPAKIITQMAEKGDYDLIVMGSKGQGARMRFLLGSVSSHVIHYANRSVLIVPMRQDEKGTIVALSPEGTISRLVNLYIASMGAVGSYVREKMDESSLQGIFEYESEKFSKGLEKFVWRADDIAKDMIRLNFQPYGMEAKYSGDGEKATIIVTKCPLPEKFLQSVEFLKVFTFEQQDAIRMDQIFASPDKLSSSWDWPPKKPEVCATCRIVMPKLGKKLGFSWEHRLNDEIPPKCIFDIEIIKH